jgi:hypothetical protein
MGRKSAAKGQSSGSAKSTPPAAKGKGGLFAIIAAVVVVAGLGIAFWGTSGSGDSSASNDPMSTVTPEIEAKVRAAAALGPRQQAELPPIPFQGGYAPPRPAEVITAAYRFAAEHPEVLSYVPCFCGCQHSGHTGNASCFVKSRTAEGDVLEWDEHGVECAICIDVANRSRQMHSAGASAADIRAAIDREFGAKAQTHTPTPKPPQSAQSD